MSATRNVDISNVSDAAIYAHLSVVFHILGAFRRIPRAVPYIDDLEVEGKIGLAEAIVTYDPTRGAQFTTHATWCVLTAMRRYLRSHGSTIRIPTGVYDSRELPAGFICSLDELTNDIEAPASLLADPDLRYALSCLSESERTAIHLYYVDQYTFPEAAALTGRGVRTVIRDRDRALTKLRIILGDGWI